MKCESVERAISLASVVRSTQRLPLVEQVGLTEEFSQTRGAHPIRKRPLRLVFGGQWRKQVVHSGEPVTIAYLRLAYLRLAIFVWL